MPKKKIAVLGLAVSCSLAIYILSTKEAPSAPPLDPENDPQISPSTVSASTESLLHLRHPEGIEEFVDSIYQGRIKKGTEKDKLLKAIFIEWGTSDPQSAMAYLRGAELGIQRYSQSVLRGWTASGDLSGASSWIESNVSDQLSTPFYEAVIDGLTQIDEQSLALELIKSRPEKHQASLASHTLHDWAAKDLPSASSWLEEHQATLPVELLDGALKGYATAWAEQSPTRAVNWANTLPPGQTRMGVLHAAIDKWIQIDSAQAGTWLLTQELDEDIGSILSETAHLISHVEPQTAFKLIENDIVNQDQPYRLQGHMVMALDNLIRKNPSEAAYWIGQVEAKTKASAEAGLTHDGYRLPKESYVTMISRWAADDEAAALSYIDSALHLSSEERSYIKWESIDRIHPSDPSKAVDHLMRQWNDLDPISAAQFASAAPQEDWSGTVSNTKLHYQDVASAWAETHPSRTKYYVERQQFLSPEETATLLLAFH